MSLETSSSTPEVTPPATEVTQTPTSTPEAATTADTPPEQSEATETTQTEPTAATPQQSERAKNEESQEQAENTDTPPQQAEKADSDEAQKQDTTSSDDDETVENSQPETNEKEDETSSPSANDLIQDFQNHMNIVGTMHDKFLERLQNLHELDNKIGSSQQKLNQQKDALREILEQIDNLREFVSDTLAE